MNETEKPLNTKPLNTTGVIATRLGFPLHRVDYVIKMRGIEHTGKAGTARVYSDEQVELIERELRGIEEAQEGDDTMSTNQTNHTNQPGQSKKQFVVPAAARAQPQVLITAGSIARKYGQPMGRVQQAIRSINARETAVAGRTRVFTDVDEQFIEAECRVMASQVRKKAARRKRS